MERLSAVGGIPGGSDVRATCAASGRPSHRTCDRDAVLADWEPGERPVSNAIRRDAVTP